MTTLAERRRVARHAADALALLAPEVTLRVLWHVDLGEAHGEATLWTAPISEAWIALSEPRWDAATPDDREDTIRHEIAHVIAWARHGVRIRPHGREWLAARRDLDEALDTSGEV